MKQFHEGMAGRVSTDGDPADPFPLTNGVKQGCVLAPSLFGLFFAALLEEALHGFSNGVFVCFCTDKLFSLSHPQANTKVTEELVQELPYAADCASMAYSKAALQDLTNFFAVAAHNFGLIISQMQIKVIDQRALQHPYQDLLSLEGTMPQTV